MSECVCKRRMCAFICRRRVYICVFVGGCVGAFVSGECVHVSVDGGCERVFVRREYVRAFVGGWCVCFYMWRLLSCVSRWSTCVYS